MSAEITRYQVEPRYSESAVFQGVVYLGGIVPECESRDIRNQMLDVLAQADRSLAEAGSDKSHLLRVQIYLKEITDIQVMNEVWDQWVAAGQAPPRATVQAALADPNWKVEIVITAAVKGH